MDWKRNHNRNLILLFALYFFVQLSSAVAQEEAVNDSIYTGDYPAEVVEETTYDETEVDYEETQPVIEPVDPIPIRKKDHWTDDSRNSAKEGLSYTRDPVEPEKPKNHGANSNAFNFDSEDKSWLEKFLETRGAQIIILTVVIAFLIFFLIRFLSDRSSLQDKKVLQQQYSLDHLEENLENSDMEHFLAVALEKGDYRTAIRVFYLTIIKNLHEQKLILWKREKTNFDYVRELRGSIHYDAFRSATRAFELVWYGNAIIAEKEYLQVEPVFRRFIQNMKNGKK